MILSMADYVSRRNAQATHYESHGLHEHDSVRQARIALRNSPIRHVTRDHSVHADMAEWMWRNMASPEEAAIAFDYKLPGNQAS